MSLRVDSGELCCSGQVAGVKLQGFPGVRDIQLCPEEWIGSNWQQWKGCAQADGTIGAETGVETSERGCRAISRKVGPGVGYVTGQVGEEAEGRRLGPDDGDWQSHGKAAHILGSEDFTSN